MYTDNNNASELFEFFFELDLTAGIRSYFVSITESLSRTRGPDTHDKSAGHLERGDGDVQTSPAGEN